MPSPLPTDLSQVGQWLIMPAVLAMIANIIVNGFFANETPDRQATVKLASFIGIGVVSYLLSLIAPDVISRIEPLWAIIASVIAAYYATNAVRQIWYGLQLVGERILLGGNEFRAIYHQRKKNTVKGVPNTASSVG